MFYVNRGSTATQRSLALYPQGSYLMANTGIPFTSAQSPIPIKCSTEYPPVHVSAIPIRPSRAFPLLLLAYIRAGVVS